MRISVNTTLDKNLYKSIQMLALQLSDDNKKVYANDLIEQGMKYILSINNK